MARTARVLTIPSRMMTGGELELQRAKTMRAIKKDMRIRNLLFYSGVAALFALGMLTEYALTHWL